MRHRFGMLLFLSMAWAASGAWAAAPQQMSVQIRDGQVRATASFLGRILAPVAYGDQVQILQVQGAWRQVRTAAGVSGWMHESALTAKRIVLKAGSENVQTAASGEELALAGKGFNSDVEADFKSRNQNIDFTWIDRMEKIKVTAPEVIAFLREGGVAPQGGQP